RPRAPPGPSFRRRSHVTDPHAKPTRDSSSTTSTRRHAKHSPASATTAQSSTPATRTRPTRPPGTGQAANADPAAERGPHDRTQARQFRRSERRLERPDQTSPRGTARRHRKTIGGAMTHFEPILTQEDFDEAIRARIARERRNTTEARNDRDAFQRDARKWERYAREN